MRPFLPAEVQQMRKLVEAVVPAGCSVTASSINQGWKVSLVICGHTACHSFEMTPPMNRTRLMTIAEAWETGEYRPTTHAPKTEITTWLRSTDELTAWVKRSRRGDRAAYFEGSLAHYRQDAGKKLRKLQAAADRKTGKTKRWAKKAGEIDTLQQQLDLLSWVERLRTAGSLELVQKRKPDGTGAVYFVVKR